MIYNIIPSYQVLIAANSSKILTRTEITMKYRVKIVETIAMILEVEAQSEEEALDQVGKKYHNEEITIECNGRPEVEFLVLPTD